MNKYERIRQLENMNSRQAELIHAKDAKIANLEKQKRRAHEGRRQALAALSPKKEPETVDEWKALCAKAQAEIEAEA